jgi:hypothetical protein
MNSSRSTSPGWLRTRPTLTPLAIVVDDLDIFGAILPGEPDPPLIVDPDRILTGTVAVAVEGFQPVARRLTQVA